MLLDQAMSYLKDGLSIVGVLSIGTGVWKLASSYIAKHRALSAIDKDAREALMHQVDFAQKHARFVEEASSRETKLIRARIDQLEQDLSSFSGKLNDREYALTVVEKAASAAETLVAQELPEEYANRLVEYLRTVEPSSPGEKGAAYFLYVTTLMWTESAVMGQAAVTFIQSILAELKRDPRASGEQLARAVSEAVRSREPPAAVAAMQQRLQQAAQERVPSA